jgi:hypothetical protein
MITAEHNSRLATLVMCSLVTFASSVAYGQNTGYTGNTYPNKVNNTQGFSGFYTQVGLGYQSFTPKFSDSQYTLGATTYGSSTQVSASQGVAGTITAGYNFPLSSSFLLGVGAELSPIAGPSSAVGGATIGNVTIPAASYQFNNSYNLFASVTVPLEKATAVYGKVGYSRANVSAGPNLDSLNYSGYSLGAGYKAVLSGNVYAYIEANYFNYGRVSASGTGIIPGSATSYGYSNNSTANAYNILYGIGISF